MLGKIGITIDALLRGWRFRPRLTEGKRVLVVFQQIFGDAVVFSDAMMRYPEIFPESGGYELTFLARPAVIEFIRTVVPDSEKLRFEAVDFTKYIQDWKYYQEISRRYRGKADLLIVPVSSPSADVFACSSDAGRKIGSVRAQKLTRPRVLSMFSRYAYSERVVPDKEMMTLQRHRQLLHYLGDTDYKAKLPRLRSEPRTIPEAYCVMCVGASKRERWWPPERFSRIIDFVNEELNMDVHIVGGAEEQEAVNMLNVKHPERVLSHAGKTSFREWSTIIQHAALVVANDSATAHLAAAHRVKTVCIIGDYEFVMFPYKVDVLEPDDRLPFCVFERMNCEGCRDRGYYSGSGNPECESRIREGKCASCIDAVSVEAVKDAIMKEGYHGFIQ